jgi:DNA-binding beta-propeller fold protein YncE
MSLVLGTGDFKFRLEPNWAKLPDGWDFGEVASVAVDKRDRIYVFSRSEHPVTVFERDGTFIKAWGEGMFTRPHGLFIGPDESIYCTDDGEHTVQKCTLDGKLLMTIGTPKKPSVMWSNTPFCACTQTALSPEGDIYVSDGYGNACVHKFSPNGKHILTWGMSGSEPGEFNLPHNICCDEDGWVYVADRENHRIQVFDGKGKYQSQWNNLHRPSTIYMPGGKCPYCYIGECGPVMSINRTAVNMGPRLSIVTKDGKLVARLGDRTKENFPGPFTSPHGIAVDSKGDIYVGEVSKTAWGNLFPGQPTPDGKPRPPLQKLIKI